MKSPTYEDTRAAVTAQAQTRLQGESDTSRETNTLTCDDACVFCTLPETD
ncbi:hypothetical protein [Arthrobacter sp. MMS18-M83]|nr:hypothetical protein [Arthrobacter sp. MMS18-M83]WAH99160.1 hypothetical protein OW521_10205 [Arthrobacter sp. MMS18-M83]